MDEDEWTVERMRPLVEEWADFVYNDRSPLDGPWSRHIEQRGSVLREPATEDQVTAVEQRLGVRLPPSYRAFLLISNGADASFLGVDKTQEGNGYLAAEDVAWMRDGHPEWVELWCHEWASPDDDQPGQAGAPREVAYFDAAAEGLLVSGVSSSVFEALVPHPDGRWECWDMGRDGASANDSFAAALQWNMRYPRYRRGEPDSIELYAEAATGGDLAQLWPLADVDEQRAAAVAETFLQDDQREGAQRAKAAYVLGVLSASRVAAYREVCERVTSAVTPSARNQLDDGLGMAVLKGLAVGGDAAAIQRLQDLALTGDREIGSEARNALRFAGIID